ncbi:MAG TPA: DUF3618 domain-containing protein, partial [Rhodoglobus sp.]|nr:DUF3618 domain-containing protein [Rhodoglobus sp.]
HTHEDNRQHQTGCPGSEGNQQFGHRKASIMSATPIENRIADARSELEQTLEAIEDKLNVPKQVGELTTRVRASYERNPLPWIIGAVGAAVAVAAVVAWAILSDDD